MPAISPGLWPQGQVGPTDRPASLLYVFRNGAHDILIDRYSQVRIALAIKRVLGRPG